MIRENGENLYEQARNTEDPFRGGRSRSSDDSPGNGPGAKGFTREVSFCITT